MELELIKYLLQTIGALLGILVIVIGWIGARIHNRLDSISTSLASIETDLRSDISKHSERIVALETKVRTQ